MGSSKSQSYSLRYVAQFPAHFSRSIELFLLCGFGPSSLNEPCIEYLYPSQLLTFTASSVGHDSGTAVHIASSRLGGSWLAQHWRPTFYTSQRFGKVAFYAAPHKLLKRTPWTRQLELAKGHQFWRYCTPMGPSAAAYGREGGPLLSCKRGHRWRANWR